MNQSNPAAMNGLRPGEKRWFLLRPRQRDGRAGLTLIELIVAFTILLILSTMALPLARVRVQRDKERRLRDALTEMRKAIDRYKDYADAGKLGQVDPESHGYPESLEMLVEGVELSNGAGMDGAGGMNAGGNFGTPMGQGNRSNRNSGFGSNRSSGSGGSSGGFGSNRSSGFGSNRSGGFGSSNRSGSGSNRGGGFGSNRSSPSGFGASPGLDGGAGQDSEDDGPQKIRFLRRIPIDPISGTADWGLRSIKDPPESMSWGGRTVFDVYSKSMETALDGTHYNEW